MNEAPAPAGGAPAAPAAPNPAPNPAPAPQGGEGGQQPPAGGQQPPAGGQQPDPAPKPIGDPQNQHALEFKVPDAYKDKPWAGKVKSMDDVFKQLDNLDMLVGKKQVVPDLKTATPEQKEAFYAMLRPKDATAYTIPDEVGGFPIAPAVKEAVGKMFLANGISEVQGNAVITAYNEVGKAQLAEQFSPEGFEASMKQNFGDDHKTVTGQVRNNIKGMMTPQDQQMLDKLPNAYLGVIYRTLGNVVKHYGVKETDTAHFAGAGGASGGNDINATRAGIRSEMAKMGGQPHTAEQYQALQQKLADTYKNDPRLQSAR